MLSIPSSQIAARFAPASCAAPKLEYIDLVEWQQFVDSRPESMAFHHRNWIECLQAQYRFELLIAGLKSGGTVQAAIPFLLVRSPLGAKKLVALPFTDCLPVLSRSPAAAQALVKALISDPPPCNSMSLRTDTKLAGVASCPWWVRHEIELGYSLDSVIGKFKDSVHRNVQKADRSGVRFERRCDEQAMEDFYRLHVLTRRKLGVPVQPKRFFRLLRERVLQPGLGFIGLAVKGRRAIAAAVFLAYHGAVTYKYAASHPAALADRPNDCLVHGAIRLAVEEGFLRFDFGISARRQEGLHRFKRNWGADETDVCAIQIVGPPPAPLEDSKLFRFGSLVIRNSPAAVCRTVGAMLYRYST